MTTNPFVRIGVLGLGQIALTAHLPGFDRVRGCRLAAVASTRKIHGQNVAVQYGIPRVFRDWRRLLASRDVDAVSICLPNHLHAPACLEALRAGKHVLVEKPMAVDGKQAAAMIREARLRRRVLMVHHNMRFDPAIRCAARLLERGRVGRIFAFKCSLTHRGPEAWNPRAGWFRHRRLSGGGVLLDLGVHVFDTLRFLLGDEIQSLSAACPFRKGRLEEHACVMMRFRGGAVGTAHLSWKDTHYQNRYYFFGERGTLYVNLGKGEPVSFETRGQEGFSNPPLKPDCFKPTLYEHFVDCVRNGATPEVSGEEGARALAVAETAYRAARAGAWANVPRTRYS